MQTEKQNIVHKNKSAAHIGQHLLLTGDHADVVVIKVLLKKCCPPLLVVSANDDEVGVCVASHWITSQHLGHLATEQKNL